MGEGDKGEDGQGPTHKGLRVGAHTIDVMDWVAYRGWGGTEANTVGGSFRWGRELTCDNLGQEHTRLREQVQRPWGWLVWRVVERRQGTTR